ncbi:hypothetical protein CK203_037241 [Vitis vinifera]|uniref:Retrotransposon Copia-like N-terminal domain-containing protein n=1 Tax=Vitis vinifera TaxID=29760 RepID=A0A438HSB0_VITVI|nr:hypothetical protein CK203_037241 [Vitis vinifera]
MPKYGPAFGMATNSSSSTSDIIISSSSSSHQMETSHLPITAHKLNGQNYLQWSQSILMFIRGKEKDDYITGASAAPETIASTYKKWIAENNMVMSWLVNSMTADIDKENTSEIIQIEGILHDLRQGNLTVTEYFNTLTRLWRQLDTFEVIGSGTLAHKGNFLSAFTAGKKRKKPWIVDSGASDHMTGDATIFDTYSSCPNNLTVRIADGSLSKVAGTGSVVLSRDLTLNSVLLDLDSGKTIGNAEECSGLYILRNATIHKNNLK